MKDVGEYVIVGQHAEVKQRVTADDLAVRHGSGTIEVYATPAMIALMERAAVACVDDHLPPGWITVGISVDVRHLAATPPGGRVRAGAELVQIDGRRLVFEVSAHDDYEEIGRGTHERFFVDREDFAARAGEKKGRADECTT